MKVLLISGHAQNGKDTVASMIRAELKEQNSRVLVAHYADLLKYICRTFFGWDGEKDETGRHILQYVGTDVIRMNEPDFWVRFIGDILKYFGENWDYVLIPDTRFPNEIEVMKEYGFDVLHLRVARPDFDNGLTEEQKRHPSETALDGADADYYFQNAGGLDLLEALVHIFVKEKLYGT